MKDDGNDGQEADAKPSDHEKDAMMDKKDACRTR